MGCKIYFDILSLIASCQLTLICSNIDALFTGQMTIQRISIRKKSIALDLRWIEIHRVGSVIHLFNNWVLVLILLLMLDFTD